MTLFGALLTPFLVLPLSGAKLANPLATLGWGVACALAFALAPGGGHRLAACAHVLLLPLTLIWIGIVALTGTGPTPLALDVALSSGKAEYWTSLSVAMSSPAFLVTSTLTVLSALLALRASRLPRASGNALGLAFLVSLSPLTVVAFDGNRAPFNEWAALCSPEARRSVPLIAAFGLLRHGTGLVSEYLVFGSRVADGKSRNAADAPRHFEAKPGLVVLVVGDSMRPDALMVPGRGPWSAALHQRLRSGLGARAADACAGGNGTFVSIPLLMTNSPPQAVAATEGKPTLLGLAKAAGARTAYVSNHEDFLMPESGHDEYVSVAALGVPTFDDVAVTALEEFVARGGVGPKAAWLHLYGQHLVYADRYPHRLFPEIPAALAANEREELHYSRAAEYGAKVLLQAADILDGTREPAILVFTSDHGENLWSDGNRKRYHAGPVSGRRDTIVPVLFLWNRAFAESGGIAMLEPLITARGLLAHQDVAAAWLALIGQPGTLRPTPNPTTWGATDDGKGMREIQCAALGP